MAKRFACALMCSLLTGCSNISHPSFIHFSTSFIFPAVMTVIIGGIFFDRTILSVNILLITMVNAGCFFFLTGVAEESYRVMSLGVFSGYFAVMGAALICNTRTGQPRFGFSGRTATGVLIPALCVCTLWWVLLKG